MKESSPEILMQSVYIFGNEYLRTQPSDYPLHLLIKAVPRVILPLWTRLGKSLARKSP